MQKIIYAAIAICCLTACKNNTSNQVPPAPTKEKKTVTKMSAAEVSQKFGIDGVLQLTYSGYYEAITDSLNKEILVGTFALKSDEQQLKPEDAELFTVAEYKGSYNNGQKDGVFSMRRDFYEASDTASLNFSNGKCIDGFYKTTEAGFCTFFRGKLKNGTFEEAISNAQEIECQ